MKRKLLSVGCVLAMAMLTVFQTNAQVQPDPVLKSIDLSQIAIQKSSSKVSGPLRQLYETYSTPALSAQAKALPIEFDPMKQNMMIKGDMVLVDITVKEYSPAVRANLEKMGVKVTGTYGRVLSGMVPISSIPTLESTGAIRFVRPSYRFRRAASPLKVTGSRNAKFVVPAPVIGQGDTAIRAYLARKYYGVTGKGVKVGILSDSYNNLGTANIGVKNGELPGLENPFGHTKPVHVLQDLDDSSGADEGRGMAELIHDVAPDAEIYFYTAFLGEASFAEAIIKLAEAGCTVIVDDIGYLTDPFFQDGIIAQAVDEAKKMGVAYFSAAGNNGAVSYESEYRKSTAVPLGAGNGTAHNFRGPGTPPLYFLPVNGAY